MTGPADALQPAGHRRRRLDLDHQVDGTHVDTELQRRGGDQGRDLAGLEGVLDLEALLACNRTVVSAYQLLAGQVVETSGQPLGQATGIHEHQRRVMLADELEQHGRDRRPDRVAHLRVTRRRTFQQTGVDGLAQLTHVLDGHHHLEVEGLAHAGIDDGDGPGVPLAGVEVTGATAQESGDLVEGTLGRRQADALRRPLGEPLQPLQREREMGAPLGAGHGVDLVDHHVLDRLQDLSRVRGQHEIQRLGRGDEDVGRVACDVAAVAGGRVAGARRRAQRRHLPPGPLGLQGDAGERRPQVAIDVVGQRLQRRDVEDAAPLLLGRRVVGEQAIDDPKEGGQRLARAGRREDQRVPALADGLPTLLLGGRRLRERALEPGASQRREPTE